MQHKLNDIVQFPEQLQNKGSYWQYLAPEFGKYLQNYLKVFEEHRKELGIIPSEEDWKLLPFGSFAQNKDWKWRRQSLSILQSIIGNRHFDCILEIGSWNGWLTKLLAQKSKTVIAADYFVCPFDGISTIQTLAQNISAVQCNVEEIGSGFQPQSFDVIVLNHHLSYMNNPVDYAKKLIPLLKPNGMIISIGNTFFKNPEKKIRANAIAAQRFYEQYGMELYIQPVKGYMDFNDKKHLKDLGFEIKPYQAKFLQNTYSKFIVSAPFYTYIIYQQTA